MNVSRIILALVVSIGCSPNDTTPADSTYTGGPAPGLVTASPNVAGAPEAEFLRKMADHHEGLILMAMDAMTKASKSSTQGDAHMLHTKQAAERDSMVAMLTTQFQQTHVPAPMEKNRAQNDSLQRLSGANYDRTFYRLMIEHHREGLAMIDSMVPRFTRIDVKAMAQKMKADQQKEVADFGPKSRS